MEGLGDVGRVVSEIGAARFDLDKYVSSRHITAAVSLPFHFSVAVIARVLQEKAARFLPSVVEREREREM
jgi:hypothetical protein